MAITLKNGTAPGGAISGILGKLSKESEVFLPIGIIAVIAMLILPMPPAMLDFCLLINISGAVLILLAAVYAKEPLGVQHVPVSSLGDHPLPPCPRNLRKG